ncbi:MAG: carbohydrate kinase family protein [Ignavibacteriaceae bacterium]
MNILVIGHSVVDNIIEKDRRSIKPGGIFYTVISLLSQVEPGDKIFICTNINDDSAKLFNVAYDHVENEFIKNVNSNPRVELVVGESGERKEIYSEIPENLILPEKDLERFDGILINMITGYDLSLSQLKELRKNYNGIIYFDVHTFSRSVDEKGNRIFRRITDFNLWAECIDILQANESELLTLSDQNEEAIIVEELFTYGIKQIIITRAEKGATVFFSEDNSVKKVHKDALQTNVVNKVGCGDVFGAVYFYNYIRNKNVILALDQANLFAGIATTYSEAKDFLNLKRDANKRINKK